MGHNTSFTGIFKLNKEITLSLLRKFETLNEGEDLGIKMIDQPSGYCQWMPTKDGMGIEYDGGEKFYDYVEWIEWVITNLLKPEGYVVNGEVEWRDDYGETGKIIVKDNKVQAKKGKVTKSSLRNILILVLNGTARSKP